MVPWVAMAGPETEFVHGGLARLAERLPGLGSHRVLVLSAPSRRFVDPVVAALAGFDPQVFDGARVHVPVEVVAAAAAQLAAGAADTLVAVGGGSVVGLGKALRLTHDVRFVAVPTTYAGSEMTSMFGTTRGHTKTTGRDQRVRPDFVLYDLALTRDLPITVTVQSLVNALAHVVSIASTATLGGAGDALAAAAAVLGAIEALLLAPRDPVAREQAVRGASACAAAFDRGTPGAQHALAHLLGGALGVEHAAVHAVLLPHFIAYLRGAAPAVVDDLERALARVDLDVQVYDLLVRAGAPVSLDALGGDGAAVAAALATRPELPGQVVRDAQAGQRPPGKPVYLAP